MGYAMVMGHVLSFDVENWFDATLVGRYLQPDDKRDHAIIDETHDVLNLLAQHYIHATFFILGNVAERYPALVRAVANQGHEVACHGFQHRPLREFAPAVLRRHLKDTRALLQDLSGQPVYGFRAPSFSLNRKEAWAVSVLAEAGFTYDSSIFPMGMGLYGEPGTPTRPYRLEYGDSHLIEFPPAVGKKGPLSVPFGGGIYWRICPHWIIQHFLNAAANPATLYLHPWELGERRWPVPPHIPPPYRWTLSYGRHRTLQTLGLVLTRHTLRTAAEALALLSQDPLPVLRWAKPLSETFPGEP